MSDKMTPAQKAAASGAAGGALYGGVGSMLLGSGPKGAIRNAILAALAGGTVSGVGVGAGAKLMGDPEEDEISPYTRRGALGGATVGGGLGALLGAALGKKYLKMPKLAAIGSLSPKKAALAGGLGGAASGSYMAADEGMQLDFIQNELDAHERKRRADELAKQIMDGTYSGR
jgi:hypothetical protein